MFFLLIGAVTKTSILFFIKAIVAASKELKAKLPAVNSSLP